MQKRIIYFFQVMVIQVNFKLLKFISLDYLLCHDDQTENRAIAFILYLTPENWEEKDGGQLDLYDKCIL